MNRKGYFLISGAFFSFLSLAHLARLVSGWEITLGGAAVPRWVSFPALVVLGPLAAWGFSLAATEGRATGTRPR